MPPFIDEFKLALLYAGLIAGGTPGLAAAIYFSLAGVYSIGSVLLASLITTVGWDTLWYAIGRFVTMDRLKKISIIGNRLHLVERLEEIYRDHTFKLVFLSRFVYGTNSALSIVSGAHKISYFKFMFVSLASILGWFAFLYALGSILSPSLEQIEAIAKNFTVGFSLFVSIMIISYIAVKKIIGRLIIK